MHFGVIRLVRVVIIRVVVVVTIVMSVPVVILPELFAHLGNGAVILMIRLSESVHDKNSSKTDSPSVSR